MPYYSGWDSGYGYGYRGLYDYNPYYTPTYNGGGGPGYTPPYGADSKSGGGVTNIAPPSSSGDTKNLPPRMDLPPVRSAPEPIRSAPAAEPASTKKIDN